MPSSSPYLVIMAGGSGTRFWPRSTSRRPKQLLPFGARGATLIAQTLARFEGLVTADRRLIVTTAALQEAISAEAPGAAVLGEPQGRNTAPCIYWAARLIAERNPAAVMLVMSADHFVADVGCFRRTVADAAAWAAAHDDLVTLGVTPSRAETGYGYLRTGPPMPGGCRRVEAFVEKPSTDRAEAFLAAGNYLWNSGMFAWRAEVILREFDRWMPEMRKAWDAAGGRVAEAYPAMTALSIDFGIMEKADNVVTFPLDCGWEDVGSWASLETLGERLGVRGAGGTVLGGEVLAVQSDGNIVDVPGKLVALLGVNDLIVAEQDGAVLVAHKTRAQDVRLVVDEVKKRHPELA